MSNTREKRSRRCRKTAQVRRAEGTSRHLVGGCADRGAQEPMRCRASGRRESGRRARTTLHRVGRPRAARGAAPGAGAGAHSRPLPAASPAEAEPHGRCGGRAAPRRTPAHRHAASCRRLQGHARHQQAASSGLVPAAPGQAAAPVGQTRWRCAFCSGVEAGSLPAVPASRRVPGPAHALLCGSVVLPGKTSAGCFPFVFPVFRFGGFDLFPTPWSPGPPGGG